MADRAFPNQFKRDVTVTSTGESVDFGFVASTIQLAHDGPVPVRVNLNSTVATTGDAELKPGEVWGPVAVPWTRGMGLITTSTGHSPTVRVLALGG